MDLWAAEFGPYQRVQYFYHLLAGLTAGIHTMSMAVVGATPTHRCKLENGTFLNFSGSCHYISMNNETLPCQSWEYDGADYGSTIVTEWDLVCDRRWMSSIAQAVYMLGSLVGSPILGSTSDKYGRMKTFAASAIFQVIFAIGCAISNDYVPHIICRFFLAIFAGPGTYATAFILVMEMSPERYRTLLGFMVQAAFAVGFMLVAGWGYIIRDWRMLQFVLALHSALLLGHWWLVDESPRWLYGQKRYDEAKVIILKALKKNKKMHLVTENDISPERLKLALATSDSNEEDKTETAGITDLFKLPRMRWRMLNTSFNWFANSIGYYGLSLNTGSLVGNPYLMLFISGAIELPAYVFSFKFVDILGRRPSTFFCLVVGGTACIITTYFPQTSWSWTTATTAIVMLGKCLISASFAMIYNYTAEMFPTVVRNSAMGAAALCARLSGTITPLIFLLDTLDPKIPTVFFGVVAVLAGLLTLYLPETLHQPLPHSLQDGENFGLGDTCCHSLFRKKISPATSDLQVITDTAFNEPNSVSKESLEKTVE